MTDHDAGSGFDDLNESLKNFGGPVSGTNDAMDDEVLDDLDADLDDLDGDLGDLDGDLDFDLSQLDPEQRTQIEDAQRAMEDARARLSEVPAEVVITNHVMGLYELAAIHLSSEPPDLVQAALAIDAVACLVDGLGARLGREAATMADALSNIRLAFVQIKGS